MTDEILKAVLDEALAFLQQTSDGIFPGTLILETDYKSAQLESYSMPLLIIDMVDAPDESQYPGGTTRVDWVFGFNSYTYAPDSYVDDASPYSTSLMKIIDSIRRHFSLRFWILPARTDPNNPMTMPDIEENYGFVFTLSGLVRAKQLDQDGLIMGWRIMFDSVAIDEETNWTLDNQGPLEHVTETPLDNS
jgi:hypothetical protein